MTLIQSTVQFKNGSLLVFRLVLHQIKTKSVQRSALGFSSDDLRWSEQTCGIQLTFNK